MSVLFISLSLALESVERNDAIFVTDLEMMSFLFIAVLQFINGVSSALSITQTPTTGQN